MAGEQTPNLAPLLFSTEKCALQLRDLHNPSSDALDVALASQAGWHLISHIQTAQEEELIIAREPCG